MKGSYEKDLKSINTKSNTPLRKVMSRVRGCAEARRSQQQDLKNGGKRVGVYGS